MTLMMTSAQVVETSVDVTNKSPSQDYSHPDDQTTQTTETPGFKKCTVIEKCCDGYLREKRLQQGETPTLGKAQMLGRAIEHAKKDTLLLEGEKTSSL